MRILLLGGSGRLGSALKRLWIEQQILAPKHETLDLSDFSAVQKTIAAFRPELVINTAAYNNVDAAETDEGRRVALKINAEAPGVIASASAQAGLPFFHFSSDYVFEGVKEEGYHEYDTPRPINTYGQTKYQGEQAALANNNLTYIIRTSRLYGRQESVSLHAKRSFVEIILDEAKASPHLTVNPQERACPTWVDDVARHLAEHLFSFPEPGIYHLTNQDGASWLEWAEAIIELRNLPVTISPRDPATLKRAAARPQYSILLTTKLPTLRPWKEALRDFLL